MNQAPPGYSREKVADTDAVVATGDLNFVREAIRHSGTLYGYSAQSSEAERIPGRSTAYLIDGPGASRWFVRHLTHGGMLAPLTGDRFLRRGTPRPFNELQLSIKLRERGIPTPEVRAAVVYPSGPLYRGDVARRWITEARDLASCLFGEPSLSANERAEALYATATLLRRLVTGGIGHPDLNIRNILIGRDDAAPTAYILDLEKCTLSASARMPERMFNRLHRSLDKFESVTRRRLSAGEREILDKIEVFASGP